MTVIDAHHHLWAYSAEEYGWIGAEMGGLRRDFLGGDLERTLLAAGVSGSVVVQARQTVGETRWLLEVAARHEIIRGVVGWVPLVEDSVQGEIERLAGAGKLRGVRHVLQGEADERYMLRADFGRGVGALGKFGLRYDVLIFERQLPQTIEFVDRHPGQVFVLDHVAKPRIAAGEVERWRANIRELARRGNVYCKVSGMVTEADWNGWTAEGLKVYFDVVVEAFGARRVMFGSDWPVCLVASSYGRWLEVVRGWIGGLSLDEQGRILGGTAVEAYGL